MPKIRLTDRTIKAFKPDTKRIEYFDEVEPALSLRVTSRGIKTFIFSYYWAGNSKRYTIGTYPAFTLTKARSRVRELRLQVADGMDPAAEKQKARLKTYEKEITLNDVISDYKKIELPKKKPSTQRDYMNRIDNFISAKFGKRPIKEITHIQVRNYLERMAADTPVHAQRIQAIFSAIFSFALQREYVSKNPAANISLIKPKDYVRSVRYTPDELRALWASFEAQDEPVQSLFKVLLLTGQRSGETKRMKWQDIRDGIWTKPKTETKNSEQHALPLPPMAAKLIEALHPLTGHSEYVFQTPRKDADAPVTYIQYAAKRVRRISKVDKFRIHDLRHICTTGMASLKVPESILSRILNHGTTSNPITRMYNDYEYTPEMHNALMLWERELMKILEGTEQAEAPTFRIGTA